MATLAELIKERNTKSAELGAIFDKANTGQKDDGGNPVFDLTKAETEPAEVIRRNNELTDLGKSIDAAREIDEAYKSHQAAIKAQHRITNAFGGGAAGEDLSKVTSTKSLAEILPETDGLKAWKQTKSQQSITVPGSIKTLLTTSTGYTPFVPGDTRVVLSPQRKPMIADLIPQDDTMEQFIAYMVETLFTNNADMVAEHGVKPESALQYTRTVVQMQKAATTLPITQETLMFAPRIEALVRDRIGLMVLLKRDSQLLTGSGTAPEIKGFLNTAGVLTQAQGGDDVFTALYKAITQVRSTVGFADPTGLVIHPNNWLTMRTLKDTTGRFILGNPDEVGPERIWGLPVVPTIAEPAGTALLGDFQTYSHIDNAMDLNILLAYVNDQAIRNEITMIAEMFFCLEIYRPSAFCTITGLA